MVLKVSKLKSLANRDTLSPCHPQRISKAWSQLAGAEWVPERRQGGKSYVTCCIATSQLLLDCWKTSSGHWHAELTGCVSGKKGSASFRASLIMTNCTWRENFSGWETARLLGTSRKMSPIATPSGGSAPCSQKAGELRRTVRKPNTIC